MKLIDKNVCAPEIRARLGTAAHFCEVGMQLGASAVAIRELSKLLEILELLVLLEVQGLEVQGYPAHEK